MVSSLFNSFFCVFCMYYYPQKIRFVAIKKENQVNWPNSTKTLNIFHVVDTGHILKSNVFIVCWKSMVGMKLIFKINQALAWAVVSKEAWLRGGSTSAGDGHGGGSDTSIKDCHVFRSWLLKHKPTFSSGVWARYYWAELSLQGFFSFKRISVQDWQGLPLPLSEKHCCLQPWGEVPGTAWHRLLNERVGLMLLLDLSKHEVQVQLQAHPFKSLWCLIYELLCKPTELQPESNN